MTRLAFASAILSALSSVAAPPDSDRDFDSTVAPVLAGFCLDCHSGPKPKGDLDLTRAKAFDAAEVWKRIAAGEMPPKKPLPEAQKKIVREWIDRGAKWGTDPIDPFRITTSARAGYDWWSLQPVVRPPVPPRTSAIDHFVGAARKAKGLTASPPADKRTLIRRVYFDLIGLPPTPEEVADFEADTSPGAWSKVVERLLASPHYGERWARHWLDVVRFGETDGFERNTPRPAAWHYRDWVIRALNADMPYDLFVRRQIAGDILEPDDADAVRATGFLVAGVHNTVNGSDEMRAVARQDELEDLVGAVGQTFLGLTVNCARCHDHKFDPIAQTDFYRLSASLDGVDFGERPLPDPEVAADIARAAGHFADRRAALARFDESVRRQLRFGPPDESDSAIVRQRLAEAKLRAEMRLVLLVSRPPTRAYAVVPKVAGTTRLLHRGQPSEPGVAVAPAGVASVRSPSSDFGLSADAPDAARRVKLADWIASPTNPLFARVMVNRVWHYHFGTGLVETPSDFGFNGGRPSHPELLDWLAAEFVRPSDPSVKPFSLKHVHRLIVASETYRQSSAPDAKALAIDADDRLLWRYRPRRLEAEAIRDSMLAVSGLLDRDVGGRGFSDYRVRDFGGTAYFEPTDATGSANRRRSVYRFVPRGGNTGLLDAFDCPDSASAAPRRGSTTTPLQALSLWNNSFSLRMADALVERVGDGPTEEKVRRVWRLIYQREPTADEMAGAAKLAAQRGMKALGRALLNSNEFVSVE